MKPGDTFESITKWMPKVRKGKLIDFQESTYSSWVWPFTPQFVYHKVGYKGYFQKGQKRYFCEVVELMGYAWQRKHEHLIECRFTYKVKIIE